MDWYMTSLLWEADDLLGRPSVCRSESVPFSAVSQRSPSADAAVRSLQPKHSQQPAIIITTTEQENYCQHGGSTCQSTQWLAYSMSINPWSLPFLPLPLARYFHSLFLSYLPSSSSVLWVSEQEGRCMVRETIGEKTNDKESNHNRKREGSRG